MSACLSMLCCKWSIYYAKKGKHWQKFRVQNVNCLMHFVTLTSLSSKWSKKYWDNFETDFCKGESFHLSKQHCEVRKVAHYRVQNILESEVKLSLRGAKYNQKKSRGTKIFTGPIRGTKKSGRNLKQTLTGYPVSKMTNLLKHAPRTKDPNCLFLSPLTSKLMLILDLLLVWNPEQPGIWCSVSEKKKDISGVQLLKMKESGE